MKAVTIAAALAFAGVASFAQAADMQDMHHDHAAMTKAAQA